MAYLVPGTTNGGGSGSGVSTASAAGGAAPQQVASPLDDPGAPNIAHATRVSPTTVSTRLLTRSSVHFEPNRYVSEDLEIF